MKNRKHHLFSWWFQILFIFSPTWGNDRICFKWVETQPPTDSSADLVSSPQAPEKTPGCLGYQGELYFLVMCIINHEVRILIKQPLFRWKVSEPGDSSCDRPLSPNVGGHESPFEFGSFKRSQTCHHRRLARSFVFPL